MTHNGYEIKFTMKVPAGVDIDLFDEWCDLMDSIIQTNDQIQFKREQRFVEEQQWTITHTEESYRLVGDGETDTHFEGETLVKTPTTRITVAGDWEPLILDQPARR